MSDAPSNEASGPPRKNLSRLRAQRQARLQGSEGGSAAAEGEEGDAVPVQRQASSARPAPTAVPGRMRARDAAAPLGSSAGAPLIQEDILAKREADRKKAMNAISPDDLDKTALSLADTAQFLGFRFQDYTDLAIPAFLSRFDPELGRSGEHVIFVENAVSGVVEPREAASHAGAAVEEDEADEDSRLLGRMDGSFPGEEDPLFGWGSSVGPREGRDGALVETTQQALSHGSVSLMIRCLYLCGQGILAGFSFVTVYNMTSFSSDEEFLLNYQNTANEVRRFFYILSTIALAGGLDACLDVFAPSSTDAMAIVESPTGVKSSSLTADDKASDRNVDSKAYSSTADRPIGALPMYGLSEAHGGPLILLSLMSGLYGVCLICSLIMAPQDVLVYNKNGEEGTDWAKLALDDSDFKTGLDTWKSLAVVRLVCALTGWLIVCVLAWSRLAVSLRLIDLVVRLRQMVTRRKIRIKELEGDGDTLSGLAELKLRELIEAQRVGLHRAEEELRSRIGFMET